MRDLFTARGIDVVDLDEAGVSPASAEAAIEVFDTFEANALAKAAYFHEQTGMPTFADDSGLTVAALGGAPGVRSRRWSGRGDLAGRALDAANNAVLIAQLTRLNELPTDAAFVCAAAFVHGSRSLVRVGRIDGRIVAAARGDGGFGYDPHFVATDLGKSYGEASAAEKQATSHRSIAFASLLSALDRPAPSE